jgi:RNA polymerase sigma factor (TIGR02999 family)
MGDITQLIARARDGDRAAFDGLFSILYPELRRIAHLRLAGNVRDTLMGTTSLVHDCYLKFSQAERLTPGDRVHFLSYAATVMRSIVVDAVRAGQAERRGGDAVHVPVDTGVADSVPDNARQEILDVHAALEDLGKLDQRLVRVVEMRYFGGMKEAEIAQALGVTDRTVRRDWEKARLLLAHALREP